MTQAVVGTFSLLGVEAVPVEVQADVGAGLPTFAIVGLGDTAVLEARDRVKAALRACGFEFPGARIVVNLAPAPMRKRGTGFDLPIALSILAATRQVPTDMLKDIRVVGELALDGTVRGVPGLLAHAVEASRRGDTLVAPAGSVEALAAVTGLAYRAARSLGDFRHGLPADTPCRRGMRPPVHDGPDMSEVAGQQTAKRVLEICAAGGHNVLFVGPPGSGKTMLARRLPGILPALDAQEALETAVVHSVAGLDDGPALAGVRPFRAPHHTTTSAGLVGGGSPPLPGEASLAHNGVLFLDELPEFGPAALQALRQPMEDGTVRLVRAEGRVTYPARFALVAAMNPCPCGYLGSDVATPCHCPAGEVSRYLRRVGGPLLDRIDIAVRVDRLPPERILAGVVDEPSSCVRARVEAARAFASAARPRCTAELCGIELLSACELSARATEALTACARSFSLSGRGVTRLLRVARTIADLASSERVEEQHVLEAGTYRCQMG